MKDPLPRDFPDWFGPMLVKELRQGLKARLFEWTFISFQAVMVIVVIYHTILYGTAEDKFDTSGLNAIFWVIMGAVLILVTPGRAANALSGERKANTLELIFLTELTPWRIAFGKWASLFVQSMLFVLAVLPYALLRYFFGGVNIGEDLTILGVMVLVSAVLSAVTLAISGMPTPLRVLASIGFVFFLIPAPTMIFGALFVRSRFGLFGSGSVDVPWLLLLYDALLVLIGALEVAASTIAPPAENHAARHRLLVVAAWLPLPVLHWMHADDSIRVFQFALASVLAFLTAWWHLAAPAEALRVHVEPHAVRGPLRRAAGLFLLPGWPSAALFLILSVAVLSMTSMIGFKSMDPIAAVLTFVLGAGALMTPPLIWNLVKWRTRWPLVAYTLFLVLSAVGVMFISNLPAYAGHPLYRYPEAALFPPIGFWMRIEMGGADPRSGTWLTLSLMSLAGITAILMFQSRRYWGGVRTIIHEARARKAARAAVKATVQA